MSDVMGLMTGVATWMRLFATMRISVTPGEHHNTSSAVGHPPATSGGYQTILQCGEGEEEEDQVSWIFQGVRLATRMHVCMWIRESNDVELWKDLLRSMTSSRCAATLWMMDD